MKLTRLTFQRLMLHAIPADERIIYVLNTSPAYALEMSRRGLLNIGTVYARLARMEHAGLVRSDVDTSGRRLYRLTEQGKQLAAEGRAAQSDKWARLSCLVGG